MANPSDPDRTNRITVIRLLLAFVLVAVVGTVGVVGFFSHATVPTTTITAHHSEPLPVPAPSPEPRADTAADTTTIAPPRPPSQLTELVGPLASKRETLLRVVSNADFVMSQHSYYERLWAYCDTTAYAAIQLLKPDASAPETEYRLQADGTVLVTSGKPPMTLEHFYREGGDRLAQDCVGSFFSYGTWHDKLMPTDDQFAEIAAKATAGLEDIDKTLDSRIVEKLPKPAVKQADMKTLEPAPRPPTDSAHVSNSRSGPVRAAAPTSGVLCDGTIPVPRSGQVAFKDLPGDRLRFTLDHDAWQPTIHRQLDGRQTLVMHSLKPGLQTECHIRWEITP